MLLSLGQRFPVKKQNELFSVEIGADEALRARLGRLTFDLCHGQFYAVKREHFQEKIK